jgi:hypothetical protein
LNEDLIFFFGIFRILIDTTATILLAFFFPFFLSRSSGLNERIFVDFLFTVQPPFFSHSLSLCPLFFYFVSSAILMMLMCVCVCVCMIVALSLSLSFFFAVVVLLFCLLAVLGSQLPSFFLCVSLYVCVEIFMSYKKTCGSIFSVRWLLLFFFRVLL